MAIRVVVAGATGWAGSAVTRAILSSPDLELCGAVSRQNAGKDLGKTLGLDENGILIHATVIEALKTHPDVLVDYTHPLVVKDHTLAALNHGVNVVVGTSGLNAHDYRDIAQVAETVKKGVVAAGNFCLSAALAKHFSLIAAQHMPSWEIVEYADANKVDAPSGTVQELAESLGEIRQPDVHIATEHILGSPATRGGMIAGVPVHSLRLPSYVLGFEVIFGLGDERLLIRHESGASPEPFVAGTLMAVKRATTLVGLVRGLDRLLFDTQDRDDEKSQ
jgi:4-hydroxy-tetrahydrodipicolinate reductase